MYQFELRYRTPLGVRIHLYENETREGGEKYADDYCSHPCMEMISLSVHRKPSGDAADDGRGNPGEVPDQQLHPDEASPFGETERKRYADFGPIAFVDPVDRGEWAELYEALVERDFLLVVCDPDEFKMLKITKHLYFVKGALKAYPFKAPFEVSELSRVFANRKQVPEQVEGDRGHGGLLPVSETTPA